MLRLLFSIVRNVISVSKLTSLWDCSLGVFFNCHYGIIGSIPCGCITIVTVFDFFIVFVIVFLLVRSCLLITLIKCLNGHRSLESLFRVFSKCLCHCLCLCLCLCHCLFVGQVMSPHHSDKMSQWSEVSWVALSGSSPNVFVFVFVIVFIFVIVFLLVRSCLLITLIKGLKGHKSLGSLFLGLLQMSLSLSLSLSL